MKNVPSIPAATVSERTLADPAASRRVYTEPIAFFSGLPGAPGPRTGPPARARIAVAASR